jgi:hypothetical protein
MLRLDTLLLAGASDITRYMVEENLSAVEFVRLGMCCKELHAFLQAAQGLMYLPMHRTFPCITGLAYGRKSSYYLSILKNYFGDKRFNGRGFTMTSIWHDVFPFNSSEMSVEEIISKCVYDHRHLYECARGRNVAEWCLEEIRQCILYEKERDPTEFVKVMQVLDHWILTLHNAYCVINRRLLPGIARIDPLPAYRRGVEFRMEPDSDGCDS